TLREVAVGAIAETEFVPASGRNRLRGMVESKPDWVISRQRAWGVPITVFQHKEAGEVIPSASFAKSDELMARIRAAMDEKGAEKMSKSRGNVLSPQDLMKSTGADILRLWVASSDYSSDVRFGPAILQGTAESYRKLRNTLRWMLGMLAHYDGRQTIAHD